MLCLTIITWSESSSVGLRLPISYNLAKENISSWSNVKNTKFPRCGFHNLMWESEFMVKFHTNYFQLGFMPTLSSLKPIAYHYTQRLMFVRWPASTEPIRQVHCCSLICKKRSYPLDYCGKYTHLLFLGRYKIKSINFVF